MLSMTRTLTIAIALGMLGATAGARQAPVQIQNGRVETHNATAIDREVAAAGSTATEAVWVAWREPMIDGARNMCSFYSDRDYPYGIRGDVLDSGVNGDWHPPQITPPTGPVQLEGGTGVVMLARIVDKRVERLHTVGDDCPIDANGRTVFWLNGIPIAESLRFLEAIAHPDYGAMTRGGAQSLVSEATSAIALHRGAEADAVLDRMATSDPDATLRHRAATLLGSNRGAHGFETLRRLLDSDRTTDGRRAIVSGLAQTRQPQTADVLLSLAKNDPDPQVRSEAVYYVPARGGDRVVPDVVALIQKETIPNVRQRAVSGLGQMPNDGGLTALIQLARTSTDTTVRKEAVTQIGRSKNPRAVAFLQEIIGRT
jgi:HEAT repeat protein